MHTSGKLSRRDFLKLLAASSAGAVMAGAGQLPGLRDTGNSVRPNILIFVFDAMSARHLSLYGYGRETTPNFARFASRANVYHSHFSGGSFTTTGTATLLTGLYPWSHRAINLGGIVGRNLAGHNIFQLIGDEYHRIAFAQNLWADLLLRQFSVGLDDHIPTTSFSHRTKRPLFAPHMPLDSVMGYYSYDEFLGSTHKDLTPIPGSLFLGALNIFTEQSTRDLQKPSEDYPFGIPFNGMYYYFLNDEVYAGLADIIQKSVSFPRPLFAYFHLFSPHGPYCPRKDFVDIFAEIDVPFKPRHPLSYMRYSQKELNEKRARYDEYIANVDAEFGRLFDLLDASGVLDNSYLVLTSDHGEVFERGEVGHGTALLYDPVMRIPLLISSPGQKTRFDVHTPTSSTDIVPTLLTIAGKELPDTLDGQVLPGFGGAEDPQRGVFSVEAKENYAFQPLTTATISLVKGHQKLIYYSGYRKYTDIFEFYDLEKDLEEKKDIYSVDTTASSHLRQELLDALTTVNRRFK